MQTTQNTYIIHFYCTVLIYFVFPSTEALSTDKTLYIVVGGLLGSGTCFRNCEKKRLSASQPSYPIRVRVAAIVHFAQCYAAISRPTIFS